MGLFSKIKDFFNPQAKDRRINIELLEDMLIEADFGGSLATSICKELSGISKLEKTFDLNDIKETLFKILVPKVEEYKLCEKFDEPTVFVVLGVNGSGKTTSCAKIAKYYKDRGNKVLLAAADTFRAAAGEQLALHASRIDTRIIRCDNAGNPAAVIYDALVSFEAQNDNLLIADTAGRMHTRENLISEIQKIDKIVNNKIKKENYKKFLVLDGTTGQNALSQAENFDKALGIDALILTKMDSSAKGGVLIRVADTLKIPVAFICNGEGYDNIKPFNREEFIRSIML